MALIERTQSTTPGPISRQPGMPGTSGMTGAVPRPAMPAKAVNNPAVASAPQGRPSRPPMPFQGGAGVAMPVAPGRATVPPSAPASPGSATAKPAPGPAPGVAAPGVAAGQPSVPVIQLDHVPSAADLVGLPQGAKVMTPYGELDPTTGKINPSPEGSVKYQEAVVRARRSFGMHPLAGDPNAPPPPVRLGRPMFNPFTGTWVRG